VSAAGVPRQWVNQQQIETNGFPILPDARPCISCGVTVDLEGRDDDVVGTARIKMEQCTN
jgi:hypothetical protein